jgi:hypothetical protein
MMLKILGGMPLGWLHNLQCWEPPGVSARDNFHGSRPSYGLESSLHLLHDRAMFMLCNPVATSNINMMLRTSRAQGAKFLRAPMLHLGS